MRYVREKEVCDRKRKLEEEKDANNRKRGRPKHESSHRNGPNGHKRAKHDYHYPIIEEQEVRLKDLLGSDQVDFPSDSEELAPWSPPSINSSEVRITKIKEISQEVRPPNNNEDDIKVEKPEGNEDLLDK